MKRLTCVFAIVLAVTLAPSPGAADTDGWSATGAAAGLFPSGTELGPVALNGLELGMGVLIDTNGSATGAFHAVLLGTGLAGAPQHITIEGKVHEGTGGSDGSVTFSGTATLDFGDGTAPLPGVPFSVTAAVESLTLAVDSAHLPTATMNGGVITIE
jgi:hypothetical protein